MAHPSEAREIRGPAQQDPRPVGIPTGETLRFGPDNEFAIHVRKQPEGSELCGHVIIEMFGYNASAANIPSSGLSYADMRMKFRAEDLSEEEAIEPHVPYVMLGTRRKTQDVHWYIKVNDTVIDPLTGEIKDAKTYREDEIEDVTAAFKLPFKGSTATPQEAE